MNLARIGLDMQIQTVAVIGAGTMGAGIAQVCAQSGWKTNLFDAFEDGHVSNADEDPAGLYLHDEPVHPENTHRQSPCDYVRQNAIPAAQHQPLAGYDSLPDDAVSGMTSRKGKRQRAPAGNRPGSKYPCLSPCTLGHAWCVA